jgi:RNA recognition motif-containing protein
MAVEAAPTDRLHVSNLPWSTKSEDLSAMFASFGAGDSHVSPLLPPPLRCSRPATSGGACRVARRPPNAALARGCPARRHASALASGGPPRALTHTSGTRRPPVRTCQQPRSAPLTVTSPSRSAPPPPLRLLALQVVTDRETGRSKGFGFVSFPDVAAATAARGEGGGRTKGV